MDKKSQNTKWRQKLHIEPPIGWLNDPNGLCWFQGKYHVYFQYAPDDINGGVKKSWGHYQSPDMINWEFTGTVLVPDIPEDRDGVYSGSAIVRDDMLHLFYTGNVKEKGNYDYVLNGRGANVIHVTTKDGHHMSEKKVVLRNSDYPDFCSCHVRDPKVWYENGLYYMILGARTRDDKGCVLFYQSRDLDTWEYVRTYDVPDMGYMWECPDCFMVDGHRYIGISPQGLPQETERNQNIFSSGYFLNCRCNNGFNDRFQEWDYGFDFYAPQTFAAPDGRRILIGWMGIGDSAYTNPTAALGWQHCLTIPRELSRHEDGTLLQNPVKEYESLRGEKIALKGEQKVSLPFDLTAQVNGDFEIVINNGLTLSLRENLFCMDFNNQPMGYGRMIRRVRAEHCRDIRMIADMSSIEVYLDGGRYVMGTRFYPDEENVQITANGINAEIYKMENNTLIAIGEALIDFIPDKSGCEFYEVNSFLPAVGGAPANVCGAFSRLGGKSRMITQLGADPFGDKITRTLAKAGIDTSCISYTEKANTALAFVSLAKDGNRTFSFYRKPSADMLLNEDQIKQEWFDNAFALHFCSVSLGDFPMRGAHIKAVEAARKKNAVISFDPNLRFQLWDDKVELKNVIWKFVGMTDILKISDEELEFITGMDTIEKALPMFFEKGVKLVIFTCGSKGAYSFTRNNHAFSPAIKVKAVDTTGAGDGFIGSFLWKLHELGISADSIGSLTEADMNSLLEFANKFCAISVQSPGAIDSYPSLEETQNFSI